MPRIVTRSHEINEAAEVKAQPFIPVSHVHTSVLDSTRGTWVNQPKMPHRSRLNNGITEQAGSDQHCGELLVITVYITAMDELQ